MFVLRVFPVLGLLSALAGCSQLQKATDSSLLSSGSQHTLSPWHLESFQYCHVEGSDLDEFELPRTVDLWDKLREGFAMPQIHNDRVDKELDRYSRHPNYMAQVTQRGSLYLYHISEELDRRGMPMELALLPIVESAFDPFAYSRSRASGMWQVIPGTGEMLGLKQNWWYDGRRDVVASTDAALNYLEQLHGRFDGDWLLALAAYNSGAANVFRAMRRNRDQGLPTDYWSLNLPRETKAYVPRLLALRQLVLEPEKYSQRLYSVPNEPQFEVIDVESQVDLALAAKMADISMREFSALNPGFNRWATDPDGPHQLLVPVAAAERFSLQLAALPANERVVWNRYTIKPGDTLSHIARRHNITVDSLKAINDLPNHRIRAGRTLLVPVATEGAEHYVNTVVQRREQRQSQGRGRKTEYTVKSGDSLWTIGRRHKVSTGQLAAWNNFAPSDPIHPGQTLVLWRDQATAANNDAGVVRRINYTVRRGDSLAAIGQRFNVRVADIVSWNNVNPNKYLQPGDSLTLHVNITQNN